jgi:RNA-directed DNA polymerase
LANVYLHELDKFMDDYQRRFDKGKIRAIRAEYSRLNMNVQHRWKKVHRLRSEGKADDPAVDRAISEIAVINERRAAMPVTEPFDPNFRRLRYVRYADDFLIGVIGGKDDACEIMAIVRAFLTSCLKLEASEEKSRIAKASDGVRFLGYDVKTCTQRRTKTVRRNGRTYKPRISSDLVQLSLPWDKVAQFCAAKDYGDWSSLKARHRSCLLHCSDVETVMAYNAEIRGFANYYALAWDVKKKLNKLRLVWITSFGRTLAGKYQCGTRQVFDRMRCGQDYQVSYEVNGKPKTVKLWKSSELKATPARYGAVDTAPNTAVWNINRNEFVERLNAQQCEYCGVTDTACEVHHVRKMADMKAAPFGRHIIAA